MKEKFVYWRVDGFDINISLFIGSVNWWNLLSEWKRKGRLGDTERIHSILGDLLIEWRIEGQVGWLNERIRIEERFGLVTEEECIEWRRMDELIV